MTKDELMKRLVKIEATPLRNSVLPRESVRRDMNYIDASSDDSTVKFDSFFDFEKDISEIESARAQMERMSQLEPLMDTLVKEESNIILEEDPDGKLGDPDSFFIFKEDEEITTTINEDTKEECVELVSEENSNEVSESLEEVLVKSDVEPEKSTVIEFRFCKYIKEGGEPCRRQAPKNGEYCSSHRKLIAKQLGQ